VPFQPLQGLAKAQPVEVHHQVDGATAPASEVPVDELGPGDREHALWGVPLVGIGTVRFSARAAQHGGQGERPHPVGPLAPSHGSAESLPRKVTHSFMLKTWLASVSRSMRAAVTRGA